MRSFRLTRRYSTVTSMQKYCLGRVYTRLAGVISESRVALDVCGNAIAAIWGAMTAKLQQRKAILACQQCLPMRAFGDFGLTGGCCSVRVQGSAAPAGAEEGRFVSYAEYYAERWGRGGLCPDQPLLKASRMPRLTLLAAAVQTGKHARKRAPSPLDKQLEGGCAD